MFNVINLENLSYETICTTILHTLPSHMCVLTGTENWDKRGWTPLCLDIHKLQKLFPLPKSVHSKETRPLTPETRVQFQNSPCRICVGEIGTEIRFTSSVSALPSQHPFTNAAYPFIRSFINPPATRHILTN